ncbi:PREDICTED: uncharacterized protein LOC107194376 [Dufourea novaeangliae]|uniref:uncharacterized protein LOC107194376 n=1 Tax=Dufourea novaeangliae TaxID=178035 RepID=UPI0007673F7B|nr:PREDICTED: uncharacterized protein LOC107194376 [Dufourea novaeangliae]
MEVEFMYIKVSTKKQKHHSVPTDHRSSSRKLHQTQPNMKCFAAIVLLAMFAVAFAEEKPAEAEKLEPVAPFPGPDAPRDKRGLLLSYSAPLTYAAHSAPLTYSSSYSSLPYAYRSFPYYYNNYYVG